MLMKLRIADPGRFFQVPPTSDHSMIKWGNKLFLLGGHSKKSSDSMIVWFIDLETSHCGVVKTSGKASVARGGHSVSLAGSRLIVFGGEDRSRKLLNDVHVLDLETMTWDVIEAIHPQLLDMITLQQYMLNGTFWYLEDVLIQSSSMIFMFWTCRL
ncbi:hypothetical protein LWI29_024252 [Acer saccharum]|uniref:Uncharacterized protein n=1 Tax=Acer saccharum TaxID=4024 RepID=A0AA39SPZ4_ACESA|nr:hypothetical protein LWI29_024252 [Acer saccharum]